MAPRARRQRLAQERGVELRCQHACAAVGMSPFPQPGTSGLVWAERSRGVGLSISLLLGPARLLPLLLAH